MARSRVVRRRRAEGDLGPGGEVRRNTGEDWEAIELRSNLARHLDRTAFPATRADLLKALTARQAEQSILDLVSSLPDARFASLGELVRALGLPMEERPA